MNSYFTLEAAKSKGSLNIWGSASDVEILRWLVDAARDIDRDLGQHFYSFLQAKLLDGPGGLKLTVPPLIAITSLKTDDNRDRTHETTWATTDYRKREPNADPTSRGNVDSRPYWQIWIDTTSGGSKSAWPWGDEVIEITGRWGYWEHLVTATETMAVLDDSATAIVVSTKTDLQVGHTILVSGTEQMYIESQGPAEAGFKVIRGMNGTTAVSHLEAASIQIYEYPSLISDACYAQAVRLFKRGSTGFTASSFDGGGAFPGRDPDVIQMRATYKHWTVA